MRTILSRFAQNRFLFAALILMTFSSLENLSARLHDLPLDDPLETYRNTQCTWGPGEEQAFIPNQSSSAPLYSQFDKATFECMGINLIAYDALVQFVASSMNAIEQAAIKNRSADPHCNLAQSKALHSFETPLFDFTESFADIEVLESDDPFDDRFDFPFDATTDELTSQSVDFIQPQFTAPQLEGKDFIVLPCQVKQWNCVPKFNLAALQQSLGVSEPKAKRLDCLVLLEDGEMPPTTELISSQVSYVAGNKHAFAHHLADGLDAVARSLRAWAKTLRNDAYADDSVTQFANRPSGDGAR